MTSIRSYVDEIRICARCAQPAYLETEGQGAGLWWHFDEQWDGVICPVFPGAEAHIKIDWDRITLETLKSRYPDTHPSSPAR